MKRIVPALLSALSSLTMYLCIFLSPAFAEVVIEDDWESGVIDGSKWQVFGSPTPSLVSPGYNSNYAFDPQGDGSWGSGVNAIMKLSLPNGWSISFDAANITATSYWQGAHVGFSRNPQGDGLTNWYVDIGIIGETEGGRWPWPRFVRYYADGEYYDEPIDEAWHHYEIKSLPDGRVAFYLDGSLRYESQNIIEINSANFFVEGRSYAGPVLVDNVLVQTSNTPPTAKAGPDQAIRAGEIVTLNGTATFDDNTPTEDLAYAWEFISVPTDSSAVFDDASSSTPSFIADKTGTYIAQLIVTDTAGLSSDPDEVEVGTDNLAPTANAGDDQLVIVNTLVELDGTTSSDPENDPLTYEWEITAAPNLSVATVSDLASVSPTIIPDLVGSYDLTLVVEDAIGPGEPDTVSIVASTAGDYAESFIIEAANEIAALTETEVTTGGNQNALGNFLTQAVLAIQQGDYDAAIDKLTQAISRTDGCVLRGAPDGNGAGRDWVIDCAAQEVIYANLTEALAAISPD